jgi:hypothetical protein
MKFDDHEWPLDEDLEGISSDSPEINFQFEKKMGSITPVCNLTALWKRWLPVTWRGRSLDASQCALMEHIALFPFPRSFNVGAVSERRDKQ